MTVTRFEITMKNTNNTKLVTVGDLVKELKRYEKNHWDWNVEITAEGVEGDEEDPTCIITGMGLDEDGDLRIEIEEEWAGGGDYYIAELLEQLRDYNAGTRVYLAGGGLLFSIENNGGIFEKTDDDILGCSATAFGEYKEKPAKGGSKAEKREQPEKKRTKFGKVPWGFIALVLLAIVVMTAVLQLGIYYNVLAISIAAFVGLIAIIVVVARVETCPYCGSVRLKKEKIDPNLNIARWSVRCKKCGKDFFME